MVAAPPMAAGTPVEKITTEAPVEETAAEALIGNKMINARAETVAEKPSFRKAFRNHRCLVLADGFYEWQKTGNGKQPYYIRIVGELVAVMVKVSCSPTVTRSGLAVLSSVSLGSCD